MLSITGFAGKYSAYKHMQNQTKIDQINSSDHYALDFESFGTVRRPRICSLTCQKSLLIALINYFRSIDEYNSIYSKTRDFDVKYAPKRNKQINKQIIAHRMKRIKQIVNILSMVSFELQFFAL